MHAHTQTHTHMQIYMPPRTRYAHACKVDSTGVYASAHTVTRIVAMTLSAMLPSSHIPYPQVWMYMCTRVAGPEWNIDCDLEFR